MVLVGLKKKRNNSKGANPSAKYPKNEDFGGGQFQVETSPLNPGQIPLKMLPLRCLEPQRRTIVEELEGRGNRTGTLLAPDFSKHNMIDISFPTCSYF